MESALRAGIALFNEGYYHAAHDAWEDHWLSLEGGEPDERFLHGLIQYTAAVHHFEHENLAGAKGLADSAQEYLADLGSTFRGVALDPIRDQLRTIADGSVSGDVERIKHGSQPLEFEDLDADATWIVAAVLAEEHDQWSRATIAEAVEFARAEGIEGRFGTLLVDFVGEPTHRGLIYDRLERHVDRERGRESGIEDLFETNDRD